MAKIIIIITVADHFYDMEGSLSKLEVFTVAVKRYFPYVYYSMHSLDNRMNDILILNGFNKAIDDNYFADGMTKDNGDIIVNVIDDFINTTTTNSICALNTYTN